MWGRFAALLFLAGVAPTELLAMNMRADVPASRCVVAGAEKFRPGSIGGAAICSEVERAIAAQAPTARYSAEIKVLSPSRLAATLIVDGRTLPVQNFAVMDGKLGATSIERFASALARAVVEATKS